MAALPAQIDTASVEAAHQPQIGGFTQRKLALLQRKPSDMTADVAAELGGDCKRFLDELETQRKSLKEPILEAGRKLDDFFKRMAAPVIEARSAANQCVAEWDVEKRRRIEFERRSREKEERERAEKEHQQQVDALVAEAAATGDESLLDEARRVEETPVVPIAVATPAVSKTDGAGVRYTLKGTVEDGYELMRWILGHKGVIRVSFSQGDIDRALNRGLTLPGVAVSKTAIVSNMVKRNG